MEELGCQAILTHPKHGEILKQILAGLDVSDPGRSTNAAFALGRLVEADEGKKIFVASCGQYKIVSDYLFRSHSLSCALVRRPAANARKKRGEGREQKRLLRNELPMHHSLRLPVMSAVHGNLSSHRLSYRSDPVDWRTGNCVVRSHVGASSPDTSSRFDGLSSL